MGVVPYQLPAASLTPGVDAAAILELPINTGQTLAEGDFAIVSGGALTKAATGTSTNIAGIMMQASGTNYYAGVGGSAAARSVQSFFGASEAGVLYTASPTLYKFYVLGSGQYAEMSLVQTYAQSLIGAAVGITLDGTTGIFVADTSQTQVGVIVRQSESALGYQSSGSGGIGDTGVRVVVRFITTALAF